MDLLLDTRQTEVFASESGFFLGAVNPASTQLHVKDLKFFAFAGQITTIMATPAGHGVAVEVEKDSGGARSCVFEHEREKEEEDSLFKVYTQEGCLLECR